jgi:hypothetical protein
MSKLGALTVHVDNLVFEETKCMNCFVSILTKHMCTEWSEHHPDTRREERVRESTFLARLAIA